MVIQCERIWLFETSVSSPLFIGTKDGVTPIMNNPRVIEDLNIETVYFFLDTLVKGGITYTMKYGGEDDEILDSYGKSHQTYTLEFNLPITSQKRIEEMAGKEFAVLVMRRDLSNFVIFGRFVMEDLLIDNDVIQRVRFVTQNTNARIYNVLNFNIETIIDEVIEGDLNGGGFDYVLDFQID